MAVDTLFQPVSGAGTASSGDYVKDHFLDTSRPATNNSNLTSSASTNPIGFSFNNTDTPTRGVKTLFIKDAVLIEDRSKWVSNKPTYEISFTEYNPAVRAYAVGNIRIRNSIKGKVLELRSIDDLFGVTGIINQLAWNVAPQTQATATADTYTDGASVSTITFQGEATDAGAQGVTPFNLYLQSATPSSTNIHDFRLEANQAGGLLDIAGVVCYFNSTDIVCRPGSTYNDKNLIVTTTGATLPIAVPAGSNGAKSLVYKSSTGVYTQVTNEPANLTSIGQGTINTNLITVSAGHGASFSAGYGIVCAASNGASMYYGIISNVSTDTLTVGPTLTIGLSGTLYKTFAAGPTFAISASYYKLSKTLDFYELNNPLQSGVFGATLQGEMYFADPLQQYYAFGKDLQFQSIDGYIGLGFEGNTSAFLQVDGNFAAADIEFMSSGIFNATFSINGAPAWSRNSGSSGLFRATVFSDGGPGWNNFVMSPGQSYVGAVITKVNLYELATPVGFTAGLLSKYDTFSNKVNRNLVENATISQLGPMQRIYADQLNLQGGWTRGVSHIFAGNVAYYGATANCVMNFQYYGKNFALLGTEGGSMSLTLDGLSLGSGFNTLKTVSSEGWHSLALTYKAGATSIIQAVSYERPTTSELVSIQQKEPREDLKLIPKTFIQSDTPREAKDGDVWVQQKVTTSQSLPVVWFKLYGQWNRIQFNAVTDDPNISSFVTYGGDSGGSNTPLVNAELFNGSYWTTISNMVLANRLGATCDNGFNFGTHSIDGFNTVPTAALKHERYSGSAWATLTNRAAVKITSSSCAAFGLLSVNKGSSDQTAPNATSAYDLWSGAAWSAGTAWASVSYGQLSFIVSNLVSAAGGLNGAGAYTSVHDQKNSAGANSVGTNVAAAGVSGEGTTLKLLNLAVLFNYSQANTSNAYTWNGSAWSTAFTTPLTITSLNGNGSGVATNLGIVAGGFDGATDQKGGVAFNGTAFYAVAARSLGRGDGSGGTLGV